MLALHVLSQILFMCIKEGDCVLRFGGRDGCHLDVRDELCVRRRVACTAVGGGG